MPIKPEDFPSRFPEDVFIQQKLDPDGVVRCPYNVAHVVSAKRFPLHLQRCRKNYGDMGIELRTCPFNALHDVDESIYFEHMGSCPDRVLLNDDLEVDANNTIRCTIYDAKGDTTVPPYDDAVAISQQESPDGFNLEVWSEHSGDGCVISYAPDPSYRDPSREYEMAMARAIRSDQTLLDLPGMKKKMSKAAREPRPVVYIENILIEEELKKARKKERKERSENERAEEKAKRKAEKGKRKSEKEEKKLEREKRKAEKEKRRPEKERRKKGTEKGKGKAESPTRSKKRKKSEEELEGSERLDLPASADQSVEDLLVQASVKLEKLQKHPKLPKRKSSSRKNSQPTKIFVPTLSAIQESPFLSTAYRMGLVVLRDKADEEKKARKSRKAKAHSESIKETGPIATSQSEVLESAPPRSEPRFSDADNPVSSELGEKRPMTESSPAAPSIAVDDPIKLNPGVSSHPALDPFGFNKALEGGQKKSPREESIRTDSNPSRIGPLRINGLTEGLDVERRRFVTDVYERARRQFLLDHGLEVEDEESSDLIESLRLLRFEVIEDQVKRKD